MPLSPQDKQRILADNSLDATQYDIVESPLGYEITKLNNVAPTAQVGMQAFSTAQPANTDGSSTVGTLARGAAASAIPSAAGLGATAWVSGLTTPLRAIPTPWTQAVGWGAPLLAGLATGFGASKAQEAVLPDAAKEQLAKDYQQHPYASVVGSAIPSALAFKPDLKAIGSAGRGVGELVRSGISGQAANPKNLNNLINVGANVAPNIGINAYQYLQNPEAYNEGAGLLDLALSALINNPRNWTTKTLGFTPNQYPTKAELTSAVPYNLRDTQPLVNEFSTADRASESLINPNVGIKDMVYPKDKKGNTLPVKMTESQIEAAQQKGNPYTTAQGLKQDFNAEQVDTATLEGEGGIVRDVEPSRTKNIDYLKAEQERLLQQQEEILAQANAKLKQENSNLTGRIAPELVPLGKYSTAVAANDLADSLQPKFSDVSVEQQAKLKESASGNNLRNVNRNEEVASQTDLDMRKAEGLGDRYQSKNATPEESKVVKKWLGDWFGRIGEHRGIKTEVDATNSLTDEAGNPVHGKATPYGSADRKVTVGTEREDTLAHEPMHIFLDDLSKSPRASDRAIAAKAKQAFGIADSDTTAESLVQRVGEQTIKDLKAQNPSLFRDLMDAIKVRWGNPSQEQVARVMSSKLRLDPSHKDVSALAKPSVAASTTLGKTRYKLNELSEYNKVVKRIDELETLEDKRNLTSTEDSELSSLRAQRDLLTKQFPTSEKTRNQPKDKEADIKRFTELQAKIIEKNKAMTLENMDATLAELKPFWQEMETIKNKYGGHVPKADSNDNRYQPKDDDFFTTATERELKKDKPFGIQTDKEGAVSKATLLAKIKNATSKEEYEALQEQGLFDFLNSKEADRVKLTELNDWVNANAPKVEVKKLDATSRPSGEYEYLTQRISGIQHRLDTIGADDYTAMVNGRYVKTEGEIPPVIKEEIEGLTKEFNQLKDELESKYKDGNPKTSDSATARYTMVNPKPLDQMEGAVDILVRKPTKQPVDKNEYAEMQKTGKGLVKFRGNHFGSSDNNIIGWTRGYMETLPDGKKVFHIFELQSDWAQQARETEEAITKLRKELAENITEIPSEVKNLVRWKYDDNGTEYEFYAKTKQEAIDYVIGREGNRFQEQKQLKDPAIAYYEQLALKAAIKHAIDNGADAIAISDANTAMLTEGHDKMGQAIKPATIQDVKNIYKNQTSMGSRVDIEKIHGKDWESGEYAFFRRDVFRIDKPELNEVIDGGQDGPRLVREIILPNYKKGYDIAQEKGMRLHYDNTVPNILRKLTGAEPTDVNFGEHKNVIDNEISPLESGMIPPERPYRDSLIIKNQDGNVKTDITARMFDLTNIKQRVEKGEKFSIYSSRYQKKGDVNTHPYLKDGDVEYDKPKTGKLPDDEVSLPPGLEPHLNTIARKGPVASEFKDAVSEAFALSRATEASYRLPAELRKGMSEDEANTLGKVLAIERQDGESHRDELTTDAQLNAYDEFRSVIGKMADDQIADNQPVYDDKGKPQVRGKDPFYWPAIPSKSAIRVLNSASPDDPAFVQLKQDYIDYAKSKNVLEPEKAFDDLRSQYSGTSADAPKFGAVRRTEGIGLPYKWTEKNPFDAFERYNNRFSKDRAWFKAVESNPRMRAFLGLPEDAWGNVNDEALVKDVPDMSSDTDVKYAIKQMIGAPDYNRTGWWDNMSKVVTNLMMGPFTGAGNIISSAVNMSKYVRPTEIPSLLSQWRNVGDGFKTGKETGLIKDKFSQMTELYEPVSDWATRLDSMADLVADVSLRNPLEKLNRAGTQVMAEFVIKQKIAEGDDAFLKRLANNKEWSELSEQELATRLAEIVDGTYDIRGLPKWMIDSNVAPFFRLQRWSVQQTNNFMKDVVTPAKQGNYGPLFTTLFGSVIGGLMLKELRETVNDKKDIVPSLKEVYNADATDEQKAKQYSYTLVSAAAYAGLAGMMSDVARMMMDVANSNKPQGFTYPLVDATVDVADKVADATKAIADGADIAKVSRALSVDLIKGHIQALRIVLNQANRVAPDSKLARDNKRNAAMGDLRRFKQINDEPVTEIGGEFGANAYANIEQREFKRETSATEAAKMLPKLIGDIVKKHGSNPEELKKALKSLKQNNYQTMPNPENMPMSFIRYLTHLKKTQGEEVASKRLSDYLTQNAVNQVKADMVPSL